MLPEKNDYPDAVTMRALVNNKLKNDKLEKECKHEEKNIQLEVDIADIKLEAVGFVGKKLHLIEDYAKSGRYKLTIY